MYRWTDTFNHEQHVAAHGQSRSCRTCHADRSAARSRAGSKACASCHATPPSRATRVRVTQEAEAGLAPGYRRAMHGLCLRCHREQEKDVTPRDLYLSRCETCHRDELAPDAEMRPREPLTLAATSVAAGDSGLEGPSTGGGLRGSP
jgi:hypothetical protein